jgi:F-type H+-transporting ATPase subunit c
MKKIWTSLTMLFLTTMPALAMASDAPDAGGGGSEKFAIALATGFAIGIAALGGALGQGRAASAALEGIARNPGAAGKIVTPMIIGLALIESLVIYGLVVAILLWLKL